MRDAASQWLQIVSGDLISGLPPVGICAFARKETVMKSFWLLLVCVLPSMCFAQTTVKYTLSGTYIFELSGKSSGVSWSKTFGGCTDSNGTLEFATDGGSMNYSRTVWGTLTFNGTTGLSAKTTTNVFDQSKSNATVPAPTWSHDAYGYCVATFSNNGYAVFDPFTVVSSTGSYSINATGTGTLSLSAYGLVVYFQTTGSFASCASGGTIYVVPNTIILEALSPKTPNFIGDTGVAEHANQAMMGCPPSFQ